MKIVTLYQKLLYVFLVFTIIYVSVGSGLAQTSDIQDHWANDVIQEWTDLNLITGYEDGSFKPNHSITRAEFMTLANRAFGFTEIEKGRGFPDVKPDAWFVTEVQKAITAGYIGGYEDGTMKPNQPISRQEVAVMITKIQGLHTNQSSADQFKDTIPAWAKGSVGAVAESGFMSGYPDQTFRPTASITRAEVVVTLDRVLKDSQHVYNQTGTFGPTTGVEEITGNVRITASNVTLQNVIITGNLIIDESVGEGNVLFKGVTVEGNTYIYGGGENSVYFQDTKLVNVVVNKKSGTIRIVVNGKSEINKTIIYSPTNMELGTDEKIVELVIKALTKVIGTSVIDKAIINVDGVKFETFPQKIEVKDGVSDPTKIEKTIPQTGGGGGASVEKTVLEITGHLALSDVTINTDQGLIDIGRLKASGVLPTEVELTYQGGSVDAVITDWTGTYSGKVTGTYTLTAEYIVPEGYKQGNTSEVITVDVVLSIIQTEEITGHSALAGITINTDQSLIDIARLKASGMLPTQVELIYEDGTVDAVITDWTGTYYGKMPGTYTLTAEYTLLVGYRHGATPEVVTVEVNVSTAQTLEITGHSSLADVTLISDDSLIDIERLKASGVLATQVELIHVGGTVDAVITDWTGTYDGKMPGTYTLTAEYTLPVGYRQGATPSVVTVEIIVSTAQTVEIKGHSSLANVTLTSDDSLIDIERLKVSGVLPTQVELTTEGGTVDAVITDWTGTYNGKITGTYTLTAEYTLPVGYRQGATPEVVAVNVVVSTTQTEEIKGHSALSDITINTDQSLLDIARLKARGVLPTQVDLTTETGTVAATITNWTGSYDGKVTGTYTLTAEYTLPVGYRQGATPEVVTVDVVVSAIQLEEVTGHSTLPVVTIYTDQGLPDIVRLKTSGVLPTQVNLTTEMGTVTATITNWTGSYDGRITGTYTLTAIYTLPVGYRQGATPEVVTVEVVVIYKEDSRVVSKSPTTLYIGDISNSFIEIIVNGIDFHNDLDFHKMMDQSSFIGDFENVSVNSVAMNTLTMSISYLINSGTVTNNTGNAILRIPVKTGNDIIVYFDTVN